MNLKTELGLAQPLETQENECLLNILFTATILYKISYKFFKKFDLSDAQFNVLMQLCYAEESSLSQVELSRRLVVNKTDMTGIIDRLEKAQMVERVAHPNDRRVNMIRVTEKGRELVKKIEPHYMEEIFKLMKGLSKQDMQRLIQGLEKVRENIRTSKML